MKLLPILLLAFWTLSACQSSPKEKTETVQAQEVPKETQKKTTVEQKATLPPSPVKPKDKLVGKTSTGKAFVVERKEIGGKVEYVLNGEGFEFGKETRMFNHAEVKEVLVGDLDKNGFDEAYIIYDCKEDGEPTPVIAGFVSYKDRSFGSIYVKAPSSKLLKGYNGHDRIYMENGQLIREYPIFDGDMKTEHMQKMTYVLTAGEAGFILQPRK